MSGRGTSESDAGSGSGPDAGRGSEPAYRSGFVAIVGRPNVGKSTLLNRLVGERLAITTPKPQTTREQLRGIRTTDRGQIVYVDTPGIHEGEGSSTRGARRQPSNLNRYMVEQAVGTLGDADLVHLLVDAGRMLERPSPEAPPEEAEGRVSERAIAELETVLEPLARVGTPVLLLVNKIDLVRDKRQLLPLIERLRELVAFREAVPISAQTGDGLERLEEATLPHLPEGPPLFPEDALTDRSLRFFAAEMIREPLFLALQQELPYRAAVSIDAWEDPRATEDAEAAAGAGAKGAGTLRIYATIHVARESQKGIVIGRGGRQLREIGRGARRRIEDFLERRVHLDLRVRVEPDWMERPGALRKLGYDEE